MTIYSTMGLTNKFELERMRIILALNDSQEFTFYPTGSRFFGGYNDFSDYDYYIQNSIEVRSFLVKLDFHPIEIDETEFESYRDRQIEQVFRNGSGVDVQLVKDVIIKRIAHFIVNPLLIKKYHPDRNNEWNHAYRVAKVIIETVYDSWRGYFDITQ